MDDWEIYHTPADAVVWHYTDAGGLIAIIKSGKLRATNAFYLNDSMEVNHCRTLITDEVSKTKGLSSGPVDDFLEQALASVRVTDYVIQPYVTCFSGEKARDLLSQFRPYGNDGSGYALGFDPQKLADLQPTCWLRKVIYDKSTQTKMIATAIQKHCDQLSAVAPSFAGKDSDAKRGNTRLQLFVQRDLSRVHVLFQARIMEGRTRVATRATHCSLQGSIGSARCRRAAV
jgi:hypothetical protein